MNRIQLSPLATLTQTKEHSQPEASQLTPAAAQIARSLRGLSTEASSSAGQPTATQTPALFTPMHYEPGFAYPLIVWLHSNGDDQTQVQRIMPSISLRNFVAVAPQAIVGSQAAGFYWQQTACGIEEAQAAVVQAIDHAQLKLNIAPQRIFLAGYGAGGTMALRVALELSHALAGVVSINGPLPSGLTPLRDWMSCRQLPIFWAHCRKSQEFPENLLCDQLKLLHIGGFSVTLRQYPAGDELPAQSLSDLNGWIMESFASTIK
jgi:phospholipase/carboxylesterase